MEFHTISASQWPGACWSEARWRSARGSGAFETALVVVAVTVSIWPGSNAAVGQNATCEFALKRAQSLWNSQCRLALKPGSWQLRLVVRFYSIVLGILGFDGVLLAVLAYAYHAKRFEPHRISLKESMKVPDGERVRNIGFIAVLSLLAVFGMTYFIYPYAFHQNPTSGSRIAFEIVGILLVYDFAYYWLHRLMHHKKLMKYVHAVHHEVHNPTAMESFYLHPIELFAGLALLISCTWLIGPVHI